MVRDAGIVKKAAIDAAVRLVIGGEVMTGEEGRCSGAGGYGIDEFNVGSVVFTGCDLHIFHPYGVAAIVSYGFPFALVAIDIVGGYDEAFKCITDIVCAVEAGEAF